MSLMSIGSSAKRSWERVGYGVRSSSFTYVLACVIEEANLCGLKITKKEMLVLVVFFCFATQIFPVLFLDDSGPIQCIKEAQRYAWIPAYLVVIDLILKRYPMQVRQLGYMGGGYPALLEQVSRCRKVDPILLADG